MLWALLKLTSGDNVTETNMESIYFEKVFNYFILNVEIQIDFL